MGTTPSMCSTTYQFNVLLICENSDKDSASSPFNVLQYDTYNIGDLIPSDIDEDKLSSIIFGTKTDASSTYKILNEKGYDNVKVNVYVLNPNHRSKLQVYCQFNSKTVFTNNFMKNVFSMKNVTLSIQPLDPGALPPIFYLQSQLSFS